MASAPRARLANAPSSTVTDPAAWAGSPSRWPASRNRFSSTTLRRSERVVWYAHGDAQVVQAESDSAFDRAYWRGQLGCNLRV